MTKKSTQSIYHKNRSTLEEFTKKANIIHNNRYDYSLVDYINTETKVKIICKEHGVFEQSPYTHVRGGNCRKCANLTISKKLMFSKDKFIKKAKSVHGELYDYSKVEYVGMHTKVTIIDPEYGEFQMKPMSHIQGQNHPLRGRKINGEKRKITKEQFIERAVKVHGNLYDYSKVEYVDSDTNVCITHPTLGEFWQTPYQHTNKGSGHPKLGRRSDNDMDHIIPIGIIVSFRSLSFVDRNRPLFKFLNSDINLRKISLKENNKKSDNITISGKEYKASNIRNMYSLIYQACKEYLQLDIMNIIEEDKKYMKNILENKQ